MAPGMGWGQGHQCSDPTLCSGAEGLPRRDGAGAGTGAQGLWAGALPAPQQPPPSRLHGSKLCNAAHTARLLRVNPINISWSCSLRGKDCDQLWLSAAPTSAALLAENI